MRIFIGSYVESEILNELKQEFNIEGVKLANGIHITYKFLGDLNEKETVWIKERLMEVNFKPFKVRLSKLGAFPSLNRINVIWVGLEPEIKVKELQNKIDNVLEERYPRNETFKAHLTLGRVKFVKDKDVLINKIGTVKVPKEEFEIKEFKLIQSVLKRAGSEYSDLETYQAE
ncbi:RNA 2',3'-cyclic phosphodiesterase [Candidatus Woesearchaeota archaeon]|nr:RNA 2',3'-cyclic phosphodiesterase [Candidatus Woesearchaeota archaeon]